MEQFEQQFEPIGGREWGLQWLSPLQSERGGSGFIAGVDKAEIRSAFLLAGSSRATRGASSAGFDVPHLLPKQASAKLRMRPASRAARLHERHRFCCDLRVSWQTCRGETKFVKARCLDLSVAGAGIECDQAIEPRTLIHLRATEFGLLGYASVRYCLRNGLKYHIGLMFSTAFKLAGGGRRRCMRQSAMQEISCSNEQAAHAWSSRY